MVSSRVQHICTWFNSSVSLNSKEMHTGPGGLAMNVIVQAAQDLFSDKEKNVFSAVSFFESPWLGFWCDVTNGQVNRDWIYPLYRKRREELSQLYIFI